MNEVAADEAGRLAHTKLASVLREEVPGQSHIEVGNGDLVGANRHDVANPDKELDHETCAEGEAGVGLAACEALL
eukprot:3773997-Alexandrium_andersonii.AAC.1